MTETTRELPITRSEVKAGNMDSVWRVFKHASTALAIPDIARELTISSRTVRRAVESLCDGNFIREAGKRQGGAMTYIAVTQEPYADDENEPSVKFGSATMPVLDFLHLIASPESNPFQQNPDVKLLRTDYVTMMRKRMAYVILTAGEAGHSAQVEKVQEQLSMVQTELQFALDQLKGFMDSAVWWDYYRDRLGYNVRKARQANPELVQLAMDYVRSGE